MYDRFFCVDPRDHETPGTPAPGRREAHKRATREAIRAAADRLISEHGYEATTVRQIAEAAKVTERTLYRYFDGKEGLVATEVSALMDELHDALLARPASERPVDAVRSALVELATKLNATPRRELLWAFTDNPGALKVMRRSGVRPLVHLETLLTDALLRRAGGDEDDRLGCELLARTCVAVMRTIGSLRRRGAFGGRAAPPGELIERAFDTLGVMFETEPQDT